MLTVSFINLLSTCFQDAFLLGLFFDQEDGGDIFLLIFGWLLRTAWHYIPEYSSLHSQYYENLKSYINYIIPFLLQLSFEVLSCFKNIYTETNDLGGSVCWPRNTLYPQKSALLRQQVAVAQSA
jgi:hypothetical protein